MGSSTRTGSRFTRRIYWLAAAVVLSVLAYTGFWFYAAHMLEQSIAGGLAELDEGRARAQCEEPETRGFPFRIGLFCSSVLYENGQTGVSVRTGALRSTATVYRPSRFLAELDGPATVSLPSLPPLRARWEGLRASTRLSGTVPERLSVEGRDIALTPEGGSAMFAVLPEMELHARRQDDDLETAVAFRGLALGEEIFAALPPLEGRMRARLDDGASLLEGQQFTLRGRSGTIEELVIGLDGEDAAVALAGPVSVDADGLVSAELSVSMEDAARVSALLTRLFPGMSEEARHVAAALDGVPLQLRIVRGRVFAGLIPLGRLSPI